MDQWTRIFNEQEKEFRDGVGETVTPGTDSTKRPPAPSDLYALTPARLESAEGGYRLRASGHLHTTASSSTS